MMQQQMQQQLQQQTAMMQAEMQRVQQLAQQEMQRELAKARAQLAQQVEKSKETVKQVLSFFNERYFLSLILLDHKPDLDNKRYFYSESTSAFPGCGSSRWAVSGLVLDQRSLSVLG
jgi:formate dehydrogenase maturation protein FdhE